MLAIETRLELRQARFEFGIFGLRPHSTLNLTKGAGRKRRFTCRATRGGCFRSERLIAEHPRKRSDGSHLRQLKTGNLKACGNREWQEVTKSRSMVTAFWRAAANCCWTQLSVMASICPMTAAPAIAAPVVCGWHQAKCRAAKARSRVSFMPVSAELPAM